MSCAVEFEFESFVCSLAKGAEGESDPEIHRLAFLVDHEQLDVVASVEDVVVVDEACFLGLFEVLFSYVEKRLRNDIVAGKRAYVAFNERDRGL